MVSKLAIFACRSALSENFYPGSRIDFLFFIDIINLSKKTLQLLKVLQSRILLPRYLFRSVCLFFFFSFFYENRPSWFLLPTYTVGRAGCAQALPPQVLARHPLFLFRSRTHSRSFITALRSFALVLVVSAHWTESLQKFLLIHHLATRMMRLRFGVSCHRHFVHS